MQLMYREKRFTLLISIKDLRKRTPIFVVPRSLSFWQIQVARPPNHEEASAGTKSRG